MSRERFRAAELVAVPAFTLESKRDAGREPGRGALAGVTAEGLLA